MRPDIRASNPTWTSSAKTGVGTALDATSRVAFTISHGILNEIYYPRIDQACTRDCGLVITDGKGYLSEEKRGHREHGRACGAGRPRVIGSSIAAATVAIRSRSPSWPIRSATSSCSASVSRCMATTPAATGCSRSLRRISSMPAGTTRPSWKRSKAGAYPSRRDAAPPLAMAASRPFKDLSVGFVGTSDGFSILKQHGFLAERYTRARDGNVALTGELDLTRTAKSSWRSASGANGTTPATSPEPASWTATRPRSASMSRPGGLGRRRSCRSMPRCPAMAPSTPIESRPPSCGRTRRRPSGAG